MDSNEILNRNFKIYNELLRGVKIAIYAGLKQHFSKQFDLETTKIVAAQVINYLLGEDIERLYQVAPEPLKSKIGLVKDRVPELARERMEHDSELREIIVYSLRMEAIYKMGEMGEKYFESGERTRIDAVLEEFGSEYPIEVTPSLYGLIVTRYLQDKNGLLQN